MRTDDQPKRFCHVCGSPAEPSSGGMPRCYECMKAAREAAERRRAERRRNYFDPPYTLRAFVLFLALWCPLVSGCGGHSFRHGTIIEKGHAEAWTEMMTSAIVVSVDPIIVIPITTPILHPELWQVKVRGKDSAGVAREEWFEVSQERWNTYEIGGKFISGER